MTDPSNSQDAQDRLLEVYLEEVVGGVKPPNLSDKILDQMSELVGADAGQQTEPEPPPIVRAPIGEALTTEADADSIADVARPAATTDFSFFAVGIAASVLIVATFIGFIAMMVQPQPGPNTADGTNKTKDEVQPKQKNNNSAKQNPTLVADNNKKKSHVDKPNKVDDPRKQQVAKQDTKQDTKQPKVNKPPKQAGPRSSPKPMQSKRGHSDAGPSDP